MKIAFVYIGSENLGIEYLSAILKEHGHEVRLFYDPSLFDDKYIFSIPSLSMIFNIREIIIKQLIDYKPDLVCFSVFTEAFLWALEMSYSIKKNLDVKILFGGVHPTMVPERVIKEKVVDMLIVGEGFEALPELVNALNNNKDISKIKNLWLKTNNKVIENPIRPVFPDLNKLPFPDKAIFAKYFSINGHYLIMTSLGCPYRCSYCSNDFFISMYKKKGPFFRRRSPENVIKELMFAHKKYNLKAIDFQDDIFTINKSWLKDFLKLYTKQLNLPYRILSHTKFVDEEIIKLLKDTRCYRVQFGVQSLNEKVRKTILNRIEKNQDIKKAFLLCEKYKLQYAVDHMYGIPTEGKEHQMEAARFYSQFKPARFGSFWLVYYPKTKITEIALKLKVLKLRDVEKFEKGFIKHYHEYGSVRDIDKQKLFDNFSVFFLLIPLLPMRLNMKLADSKLLFHLHNIPFPFKIILDFIGGIKARDIDTINYARYYMKYMIKILLLKIRSII